MNKKTTVLLFHFLGLCCINHAIGISNSHVVSINNNPFLYSAAFVDSESRHQYLNARYYAPALLRFISWDSYGDREKTTLFDERYNYAAGNPISNQDPTGHCLGCGMVNAVSHISDGDFTELVMNAGLLANPDAQVNEKVLPLLDEIDEKELPEKNYHSLSAMLKFNKLNPATITAIERFNWSYDAKSGQIITEGENSLPWRSLLRLPEDVSPEKTNTISEQILMDQFKASTKFDENIRATALKLFTGDIAIYQAKKAPYLTMLKELDENNYAHRFAIETATNAIRDIDSNAAFQTVKIHHDVVLDSFKIVKW